MPLPYPTKHVQVWGGGAYRLTLSRSGAAGGIHAGLRGSMKHDRCASTGSLGNIRSREWNGAFGLAARVGEMGPRISGQTKKRSGAATLEICQGSTDGESASL